MTRLPPFSSESDAEGEARLVAMLRDMADDYRVPSTPPPMEAMWTRIEQHAFPSRGIPIKRAPARLLRWLPVAAALALGVGVGQWTARPAAIDPVTFGRPVPREPGQDEARRDAAFAGMATDYLEHTTALLVTLTSEVQSGRSIRQAIPQARELLGTTRLLLDAPDTPDPALRALLEDLELILAQIIRVPAESPSVPEGRLIREALDQQDVIPRLQVILADSRPNY